MIKAARYFNHLVSAVLLVLVLGCAATQTQQSPGEYVDDSVITGKVKANLFNDSAVKSSDISVETFRGTVQLRGFVDNQDQINRAVEITRTTSGVKSVINDLHIKQSPKQS